MYKLRTLNPDKSAKGFYLIYLYFFRQTRKVWIQWCEYKHSEDKKELAVARYRTVYIYICTCAAVLFRSIRVVEDGEKSLLNPTEVKITPVLNDKCPQGT